MKRLPDYPTASLPGAEETADAALGSALFAMLEGAESTAEAPVLSAAELEEAWRRVRARVPPPTPPASGGEMPGEGLRQLLRAGTVRRARPKGDLTEWLSQPCQVIGQALACRRVEVWIKDCVYQQVECIAHWPDVPPVVRKMAAADFAAESASDDGATRSLRLPLEDGSEELGGDEAGFGFLCVEGLDDEGLTGTLMLDAAAALITRDFHDFETRRALDAQERLASAASQAGDWSRFLDEVTKDLFPQVFNCAAATVLWLNPAGERLYPVATTGLAAVKDEKRMDLWNVAYEKGVGLTGWVWEQRRSLRVPDDLPEHLEMLEAYHPRPEWKGLSRELLPPGTSRQLLVAPMLLDGKVRGVIRLSGRSDGRRFSLQDERLAETLGRHLAHQLVVLGSLERDQVLRRSLVEVMKEVERRDTEADIVHAFLTWATAREGIGFNRAAIWLLRPDTRALEPVLAIGARRHEDALVAWDRAAPLSIRQLLDKRLDTNAGDRDLNDGLRALRVDNVDYAVDVLSRQLRHNPGHRVMSLILRSLDPLIPVERGLREVFAMTGDEEFVLVPIWAGDQCVGVLYGDNAFDRKPIGRLEELELLQAAGRQLGTILNYRGEAAQRRVERAFQMRVSRELQQNMPMAGIAGKILNALTEELGLKRSVLYYHSAADGLLHVMAVASADQKISARLMPSATTDELFPTVVSTGMPYRSEAVERERETVISREWRKRLGLEGPAWVVPLGCLGAGENAISSFAILNGDAVARAGVTTTFENLFGSSSNLLGVAAAADAFHEQLRARQDAMRMLTEVLATFKEAQVDEVSFLSSMTKRLASLTGSVLCGIYRPRQPELDEGVTPGEPVTFARVATAGYKAPSSGRVVTRRGGRHGLTNWVLTGDVVVSEDIENDPNWSGEEREMARELAGPHRAFLGVPFIDSEHKVIGAITLTRARTAANDCLNYKKEECLLVKAIAVAITAVLEHRDGARAGLAQLQQQLERLRAVRRLSELGDRAAVSSAEGGVSPLGEMIEVLRGSVHADIVTLYRWDAQAHEAHLCLERSERPSSPRATLVDLKRVESVLRDDGEALWLPRAGDFYGGSVPDGSFAAKEDVRSLAVVPVRANKRTVGLLFICYRRPCAWEAATREMVQIWANSLGSGLIVDAPAAAPEANEAPVPTAANRRHTLPIRH